MHRDAIERLLPTVYQLAARPGSPLDAALQIMADLMNRPQAQYYIQQTVDDAGIIFEQNDGNNTTRIPVTLGIGVPFRVGGPRPGV